MEVSWGCPCGAQIVVHENRRELQCWNCGRLYRPTRDGITEAAPPDRAFTPIKRDEATFDNPDPVRRA